MPTHARARLWLAAAAATLVSCAPLPTPPGFENQPEQVAKREAALGLSTYVERVRRQDAAAISDLFTAGASIQHAGGDPVRGQAQIRRFLESFSGYRVLSYDVTVLSVSPAPTHVSQSGTYVQSVKTPDGNDVTVRGWFVMQWQRQADGRWLIELVKTSSSPMAEAGT